MKKAVTRLLFLGCLVAATGLNAQKSTAPEGTIQRAIWAAHSRQSRNVFRPVGSKVQADEQSRRNSIFSDGSRFRRRGIDRLLQNSQEQNYERKREHRHRSQFRGKQDG